MNGVAPPILNLQSKYHSIFFVKRAIAVKKDKTRTNTTQHNRRLSVGKERVIAFPARTPRPPIAAQRHERAQCGSDHSTLAVGPKPVCTVQRRRPPCNSLLNIAGLRAVDQRPVTARAQTSEAHGHVDGRHRIRQFRIPTGLRFGLGAASAGMMSDDEVHNQSWILGCR